MTRTWCYHCSRKGVCRRTRRGFWRKLSSCDSCLIQAGLDPTRPRIITCSVCFGTAIITEERLKQLTDEVDKGNSPIYLGDKLNNVRKQPNQDDLLSESTS